MELNELPLGNGRLVAISGHGISVVHPSRFELKLMQSEPLEFTTESFCSGRLIRHTIRKPSSGEAAASDVAIVLDYIDNTEPIIVRCVHTVYPMAFRFDTAIRPDIDSENRNIYICGNNLYLESSVQPGNGVIYINYGYLKLTFYYGDMRREILPKPFGYTASRLSNHLSSLAKPDKRYDEALPRELRRSLKACLERLDCLTLESGELCGADDYEQFFAAMLMIKLKRRSEALSLIKKLELSCHSAKAAAYSIILRCEFTRRFYAIDTLIRATPKLSASLETLLRADKGGYILHQNGKPSLAGTLVFLESLRSLLESQQRYRLPLDERQLSRARAQLSFAMRAFVSLFTYENELIEYDDSGRRFTSVYNDIIPFVHECGGCDILSKIYCEGSKHPISCHIRESLLSNFSTSPGLTGYIPYSAAAYLNAAQEAEPLAADAAYKNALAQLSASYCKTYEPPISRRARSTTLFEAICNCLAVLAFYERRDNFFRYYSRSNE